MAVGLLWRFRRCPRVECQVAQRGPFETDRSEPRAPSKAQATKPALLSVGTVTGLPALNAAPNIRVAHAKERVAGAVTVLEALHAPLQGWVAARLAALVSGCAAAPAPKAAPSPPPAASHVAPPAQPVHAQQKEPCTEAVLNCRCPGLEAEQCESICHAGDLDACVDAGYIREALGYGGAADRLFEKACAGNLARGCLAHGASPDDSLGCRRELGFWYWLPPPPSAQDLSHLAKRKGL